MAALKDAVQAVDAFKKEFSKANADLQLCQDMISDIKVKLLSFQALPPTFAQTATAQQEIVVARDALEHAVLLAVRGLDDAAFERHYAQLKTFYVDTAGAAPPSQQEYPIVGLNLLRLIVQNRVAEFHTELELVPAESLGNVYIKYVVELEQRLMEGAYAKVLSSRHDVPMEYYSTYMEPLAQTVRGEVASCCERAYEKLAIADVQALLGLASAEEAAEYAREAGWSVDSAGTVTFGADMDAGKKMSDEIPTMELISNSLAYARELERIV
jgi:26S proteasome regulatory subunit N12